MTCPETAHIVADQFDSAISEQARDANARHVAHCAECRAAVAGSLRVAGQLGRWQPAVVPAWSSDAARQLGHTPALQQFGSDHKRPRPWLQWLPVAACLVLTVLVAVQTRIEIGESGLQIQFGSPSGVSEQQLASLLADFSAQQQQVLQDVAQQLGDNTADNLIQMVNYLEEQRRADLEQVEAAFQHLLDQDYRTIGSMQQLAAYIENWSGPTYP